MLFTSASGWILQRYENSDFICYLYMEESSCFRETVILLQLVQGRSNCFREIVVSLAMLFKEKSSCFCYHLHKLFSWINYKWLQYEINYDYTSTSLHFLRSRKNTHWFALVLKYNFCECFPPKSTFKLHKNRN